MCSFGVAFGNTSVYDGCSTVRDLTMRAGAFHPMQQDAAGSETTIMAGPQPGSAPESRAVRRFNLTVPMADESVIAWLDMQENKSVSVRTIVRDYITRNGYTDPLCLPVEQGPRRGRPPGSIDVDREPAIESATNKPAAAKRTSTPASTNPPRQPVEPVEPAEESRVDSGSFESESFDAASVFDRVDGAENDEIAQIELDENGMPVPGAIGY